MLPLLLLGGLLPAPASALPAPSRLMVEYLPEPAGSGELLTISTLRPRFSFVPHAQHEHPGAGVAMRGYRIVVKSVPPGRGGWDSGVVSASAAVGVPCGADLKSLTAYEWTAQWYATGEQAPSPASSGAFTVGPAEADWGATRWLGGGQTEFRFTFAAGAAQMLFVAAPGGSVVYANDKPVTDECGVSAWINYSANLPYIGVDLASFLTQEDGASQTVVIKVGAGFYSGSKWRHSSTHGRFNGGSSIVSPAARLLLVDAHGAPATATLSGRVGSVVSADPFTGGIFDMTLDDDQGWATPKEITDTAAAQLDGPLRAFTQPPAKTAPDAAAALRSTVVKIDALPPAPAPSRCAVSCDPATTTSVNTTLCHGQPPEEGVSSNGWGAPATFQRGRLTQPFLSTGLRPRHGATAPVALRLQPEHRRHRRDPARRVQAQAHRDEGGDHGSVLSVQTVGLGCAAVATTLTADHCCEQARSSTRRPTRSSAHRASPSRSGSRPALSARCASRLPSSPSSPTPTCSAHPRRASCDHRSPGTAFSTSS